MADERAVVGDVTGRVGGGEEVGEAGPGEVQRWEQSSQECREGVALSVLNGARLKPQLPTTSVVTPCKILVVSSVVSSGALSAWEWTSMKPGARTSPVRSRRGVSGGKVPPGARRR
ncbi:hypothetical protein BJ970_005936 [Saccharopolyspora phatthalungensis]|uniref:Uncharacterized protein n=1 Tax=Saccharopolyspora phatthalungensis TaxID=664693 RepID=A0A840QE97_9PSEU|nr:hypothetical protein [Saccharopolyspora phatthalungensis]